jgi:hypothetical protein
MNDRRITMLLAIGAVLSAMLCVWGAVSLYSAHDAALGAQDELIQCAQLARTLALLKSGATNRDTLNSLLPEASTALTGASAKSGIAAEALQIGQPFPGSGTGVCLPIRVQGRTLEQLVTFVYRLSSAPAVRVANLAITATPGDASRWDADLMLACDISGNPTVEGR